MEPERLRRRLGCAFRARGLMLRAEAVKYLTETLQSLNEEEFEDVIDRIIDAVEKQPLSTNMIELSTVEAAVQECSQASDETMYGDIISFYLMFMGVVCMPLFLIGKYLEVGGCYTHMCFVFPGYSSAPPTCFFFCGNFSSAPYGKNQIQSLKGSLKALADIICEYPSIHKSSRFVFVPGPEDPGPGSVLPRPPLAENITQEFRQLVPFSVFTTNPCRIQYCTQEIIIFREDLVNKMCRNCVRFPSSSMDIPNHFVKTILSQGHLTPLPLYVSPVYWAYDYALRVYPVPDMLVVADKYDPFTVTNTDCLCINPGSFPRSGFSFKVFYPSNKTVEDSKLQGL
ncbi:DNA polymerase epsilon subunit 2 [Centrocercus urophasianus]|uniref:DNA polymerase epsilon subunit 2 n=1 Tax=Centrocercus urophasianus TaxID=9002 RepID=UPI001C648982|nr:DNA polymerase epsilon subunit 2 [Centrocercus urophasianus]